MGGPRRSRFRTTGARLVPGEARGLWISSRRVTVHCHGRPKPAQAGKFGQAGQPGLLGRPGRPPLPRTSVQPYSLANSAWTPHQPRDQPCLAFEYKITMSNLAVLLGCSPPETSLSCGELRPQEPPRIDSKHLPMPPILGSRLLRYAKFTPGSGPEPAKKPSIFQRTCSSSPSPGTYRGKGDQSKN